MTERHHKYFKDKLCDPYLVNDWHDRNGVIQMAVEAERAVSVSELLPYFKKPSGAGYQVYVVVEKRGEATLHSDSELSISSAIKKEVFIKEESGIKKEPGIKKEVVIKKEPILKKEVAHRRKPYIGMEFDVV